MQYMVIRKNCIKALLKILESNWFIWNVPWTMKRDVVIDGSLSALSADPDEDKCGTVM